jgi:hypothetical protein
VPVVTYTLLRLALFAVATAGVWYVGMRSWLAPLVGVLLGYALGYVLLGRQRDAAAAYVQRRAEGRPHRGTATDEDAAVEDAAVDAAIAESSPTPAPEGQQDASGDDRR